MTLSARVASLQGKAPLPAVTLQNLSGVKMKGFSLLSLQEVATSRFGAAAVEAWRASAGVDLRAVTATTWVPLEYYYHLVEYLVAGHLGGDPRAASELAAAVAKKEINAFFRFVLVFTTPSMVLGISSRFWRSYYDKSDLTVVQSRGGWVHAEIRNWPLSTEVIAYEIAGALVVWMESSRAKDVRVTRLEYSAPDVLRVEATW